MTRKSTDGTLHTPRPPFPSNCTFWTRKAVLEILLFFLVFGPFYLRVFHSISSNFNGKTFCTCLPACLRAMPGHTIRSCMHACNNVISVVFGRMFVVFSIHHITSHLFSLDLFDSSLLLLPFFPFVFFSMERNCKNNEYTRIHKKNCNVKSALTARVKTKTQKKNLNRSHRCHSPFAHTYI